jgi:hypothetical protein
MFDIGEIIDAWAQSYSPDADRKVLAELRYNICKGCEYFGEKRIITGEQYCKDCLCPISKKVFSKKFNACPQKKWEETDGAFFIEKNGKGKTLI